MSIHAQDETTRSGPHRRVERILGKMQISYESEAGFKPYSVDIYLHEWHIGIEIDGPQHSPKKDAVRDDYLREKYFLPIMRMPSTGLKAEEISWKIEEFINQWAGTAPQRKQQWRATL